MPLLNYTTSVSVSRSVQEISKALVKAGASSIMQDFDENGNISAVSFKIILEGNPIAFRLPANWQSVLEVMKHDGTPRPKLTPEHAQRVAWRITKDWVEAQMAILQTKSVVLPQLFLPYAVDGQGVTLFEKISMNPTLLLGESTEREA
jgi:hypothetical protein